MGVALIVCMLIHPVLVKFQRTGLHHYLLAYVIAVQPILIRSGWVLEFTLLAAAVLSPSVILFWWLYYNELKWLKI